MGALGSGFVNRSLWNDWAGDRPPLPGCGVRGLWTPLLGVSGPDWPSAGGAPSCCCCCSLFTCSSFCVASILACCLLF